MDTFSFSQRWDYSKEEINKRREVLMDKVKEGMIILFGDSIPPSGTHFRQDNDFYYFSGIEDLNAILVMVPKTKKSFLFLPRQTSREEMMDGVNLLEDKKAREKTGLTEVYPLNYFDEFLARNTRKSGFPLFLRLAPRDTVDNARWESEIFIARKNKIHYNNQITLDKYRIKMLQERFPCFIFKDIVPFIDAMRVIKSQEEIRTLRRNGEISAQAVREAMIKTKPGVYEYQLEAAAMHTILKNGATGAAYPPIVGSGPNSCIWHYNKNSRKIEEGDLILMDFGGDLNHLCMDITRTWPASGKFSPEQRKIYQIVLEVQKACIEAYRPGITAKDVQKYVKEAMKKKKIDTRGLKGGMHHFVGMCVHDVGPRGVPLQEGMVFTIEPGLYYPDKNIGIRIEDTILITKNGCEVLSKGVPKEIDEIEKLMAKYKN
jgi:Xaa-Pro aminopeptidase